VVVVVVMVVAHSGSSSSSSFVCNLQMCETFGQNSLDSPILYR